MRYAVTVLLLFLLAFSVQAQETTIAISISQLDEGIYTEVIEQFEAQNPDVDVRIITNPFDLIGEEPENYEEALNDQLAAVREADVIPITPDILTPEATRAGYFLDLTPLINIDATLNEADFYDVMWRSYQWDGGIWALPFDGDVSVLLYDPVAFDDAGLLYPQETWGLIELENALRDLAVYDDNGDVEETAAFDATDNAAIYAVMINLIGQNLVDDTFFPAVPRFDSFLLEDYMEIWAEVLRDELVTTQGNFDAPVLLAPSFVAGVNQIADGLEVVSLPQGRSNVEVNGYAVSAGTRNPEAAYELAKFLTFSQDLTQELATIPARRSFAESLDNGYFVQFDPFVADIIRRSLENGFSVADRLFTSDVGEAVTRMVLRGIDARTALDEVEQEALERLTYASDLFGTQDLTVQGEQEIVLAPGEIALRFGYSSIIAPLATQEDWDRLIEDFVAFDPEVGFVTFDVRQEFLTVDLAAIAEAYDCFYLPNNEVQGADLSQLLSLDPLLSTDPNFNRDDYVGNIFTQVQRNNQTWAIPLVVQPEVMFYNTEVFDQYGVPYPPAGWSVPEFEDALFNLKITNDDPTPFVPQSLGGTFMQVLIASYGGLAVDYRSNPPILQFDDPAVVDAAREVLDLAKEGYIRYNGLTQNLGFDIFGGISSDPIALYNRLLNPIGDLPFLSRGNEATDRLITFPQGSQLNAVSYDIGTVYISAFTQHADACYRFIQEIQATPALFNEMPARRSIINSPQLTDVQSLDAVEFYRALDQLMQQPSTVLIPTPLGTGLESADVFLATLWLNRAFDRYVFDDADLELELQDAQRFASEFIACSDAIPPVNPAEEEFGQYVEEVLACATDVDPTFNDLLGFE